MGRKPKYPNPEEVITSFYAAVSDSYRHPSSGDEVGDVSGRKKQELLAEEFSISRIKVCKILITTGDITPPSSITSLLSSGTSETSGSSGMKIDEIAQKLKMSKSTVNSWMGYSKGVYSLDVSAAADRTKIYRERKEAVDQLKEKTDAVALWRAICAFRDYPFRTSGRGSREGVKFRYVVSEPGSSGGHHYAGEEVDGFGNEIFVNGREKGISRSSVDCAFSVVREKGRIITGPKALKIYGSSYVYAIFKRLGLITSEELDKQLE